ncbi:hypothetical protein QVD17_21383 [Tagetes erecta]|uniref:Uncharacterized protein n=1 Tax=Tagetes erecta TaxID=13708 RepID=A0AAD8KCA1_TARER|nr:hypothetical protein QVD17_21383 [Tagetes erecta]
MASIFICLRLHLPLPHLHACPRSESFSTSSTLSHSEPSPLTDSEVALQPNNFQSLTDSEPSSVQRRSEIWFVCGGIVEEQSYLTTTMVDLETAGHHLPVKIIS